MSFATFIGQATTTLHVSAFPGNPIPIQMPSGIQAGDQLIAFLENIQINPVSISGPSGWTGTLSTGVFTKTADGSEDGAVIDWTTQNTAGAFTHPNRVIVAAVLCYRFSVTPTDISEFFQDVSGPGSSETLTDIPGTGGSAGFVTNTNLRVYCMFGQRADDPFDPAQVHPLTGISWTNPTDRTGLVTLDWDSAGNNLNDSTAMSVADIEYNFGPPFVVYNPHDAVTIFGGSDSTGGTLITVQFNLPGYFQEAYWGVNAGP